MTDKSQYHKGKHAAHSKKSRAMLRAVSPDSHQPGAQQTPDTIVSPAVPAHPVSVPSPSPVSRTVKYPYITAELKRIGILAGIMLVVLVVLALVFS